MDETKNGTTIPRLKGGIGADGPYWEALGRHELRITRCAACSHWLWPAHYRCGHCGSWDIDWVQVEPRGTLYTWSRVHYVGEEIKERREDLPYIAVLVELPQCNGARVPGVLVGSDGDVKIGAPVRGRFLPASAKTKHHPTLVWELA